MCVTFESSPLCLTFVLSPFVYSPLKLNFTSVSSALEMGPLKFMSKKDISRVRWNVEHCFIALFCFRYVCAMLTEMSFSLCFKRKNCKNTNAVGIIKYCKKLYVGTADMTADLWLPMTVKSVEIVKGRSPTDAFS